VFAGEGRLEELFDRKARPVAEPDGHDLLGHRSAVGKKCRATKGIKKGSKAQNPELHASLDAARTMPAPDEPGAPPLGPELAWASSPNPGVPEKFARGKSNRLYL
jgi:hypothetical protein